MRHATLSGGLIVSALLFASISPAAGRTPNRIIQTSPSDPSRDRVLTSMVALRGVQSGDTIQIIGPSSSTRGDFEGGSDQDLPYGWTSVDLTARTESQWHADTYNVVSGGFSAWCGEGIPSCGPGEPDGGYGNDYNEMLEWRGTVTDNTVDCTVTVQATLRHDTEPGYDFCYLSFEKLGQGFIDAVVLDGADLAAIAESTVYTPGDYLGPEQNEVVVLFRVTSDESYSDADCAWPSAGACQLDDVTIDLSNGTGYFTDFEDGTLGDFSPRYPVPVGDFARVWTGIEGIDRCRENLTAQVAFVDPGYPGMTWTYGPGGAIVNPAGGSAGPGSRIHNEIRSPVLSYPDPDHDGATLAFDVYRHHDPLNDDSPGIFYQWRVRSTESAEPADIWNEPWLGDGEFYGGGPGYYRHIVDASAYLKPQCRFVQVALGVVQPAGAAGGADGTPAPYFDNVSFVSYPSVGPRITAREMHLAQDGFPEIESIDYVEPGRNSVRFDMARNISPPQDLRNDPGDSIVFDCVVARAGAVLTGNPRLRYSLQRNPIFDPYRTSGLPDQGFVECDSVRNASGYVVPNRFCADLPDTGFLFPGDVLHYYVHAEDELGGELDSATLPGDLTGFGDFSDPSVYDPSFVVRALPTLVSGTPGDQPRVLFWYDENEWDGINEWLHAFRNVGLLCGRDWDLYWTKAAALGVGNGLGGRALPAHIDQYETILYTSGDARESTLGVGDFDRDGSDDVGLLLAWSEMPTVQSRNLLLAGDNLVADLMGSAAGSAFVNQVPGVTHVAADVAPLIAWQTAPVVAPIAGNPVFPGWYENPLFYGTCPARTVDALVEMSGTVRLAEFVAPDGATGAFPYAAAALHEYAGSAGGPAVRVVSLPFALQGVQSSAKAISVRTQMLVDILAYFAVQENPADARGIPDPALSSAVSAYTGPGPVSVYTLPDGSGYGLDNAFASGAGPVDATITVELRDGLGDVVADVPASDLRLDSGNDGLIACAAGAIADGNTNSSGIAEFRSAIFGGGSSATGELAMVYVNDEPLTSQPGLDIRFNSPDINGDLAVDLADVVLFAQDYYGAYAYRSDFFWDGTVNLADVALMARGLGKRCPELEIVTRLPLSGRARMGVFFDESASATCRDAVDPFSMVAAYICLVDPVDETGVAAWECKATIAGEATMVEATVRGQFMNIAASSGEFSVALSTPLPFAPVVVLADLQLLYAGPGPASVLLQSADPSSSMPPLPTYVTGAGAVVPVWPMSGNFATPSAVINGECPGPGVALSPNKLEFFMAPDSTGSQVLELVDTGTVGEGIPSLVWKVVDPLPDWLVVEPDSGAVTTAGDSCRLLVTVDATGLMPGHHDSHALLIESNAGFAPVVATDVLLHVGSGESLAPDPVLPGRFALHPCFPNPFNPQTTIRFDLPRATRVRLRLYDLAGRLVRTLIDDEPLAAGRREVVWRGRDDSGREAATGTYLCRLEAGDFAATRRMTLLK